MFSNFHCQGHRVMQFLQLTIIAFSVPPVSVLMNSRFLVFAISNAKTINLVVEKQGKKHYFFSLVETSLFCFRYHYNVADARLAQHVERGNADGLLISSVSSCSNLWALIMDAGTGFTNQIYELSTQFLHKVGFLYTEN